MAIDTREKRANVLGVGRPWMRTKEPDASLDEQWRIASGNAYGGNALSPPAGGTTHEVGLTFAATAGLTDISQADFSSALTLDAVNAVVIAVSAIFESGVELNTVQTIVHVSDAVFEVSITLANISTAALGAGLEIEAALSIGAQLGVALASAIAISSPTPTTRVITLTGGRTITIEVTPRTHTIN